MNRREFIRGAAAVGGQTSRLLSQKAIDGVIFHCTPLVDMNLAGGALRGHF